MSKTVFELVNLMTKTRFYADATVDKIKVKFPQRFKVFSRPWFPRFGLCLYVFGTVL